MSYVDIAIIVLVALGALIGLWKGFFKTIISFFGWLVSFLIAFFLTKIVSEALLDVGFIQSKVLGESGSLYSWVSSIIPAGIETGEGVWGTIMAPLVALAQGSGANVSVGVTLLVTNGIYSIIVCLALFIAIRIVMLLFTMFANAITANKTMGALNRLFGFILGAAKGLGFVCLVLVIMSFFMSTSFMTPIRNEIDKSLLGRPLSATVTKLTNKFISADGSLLDKLLSLTGNDNKDETQEPSAEEVARAEAQVKLKTAMNNSIYNNRLGEFTSESFDTVFNTGDGVYDPITAKVKAYFDACILKLDTAQTDYTAAQLDSFAAVIAAEADNTENGAAYTALTQYLEEMKAIVTLKNSETVPADFDAQLAALKTSADAQLMALETALKGVETFTDLFGVPTFVPVIETPEVAASASARAFGFNSKFALSF